jgi:L-threonylcarbamoyladenylate synthase
MSPTEPQERRLEELTRACEALKHGGVIAYPTEYCFGLGCDPRDGDAIHRLLTIKRRNVEQGVILIAGNLEQVELYADLGAVSNVTPVIESWPGPNTWVLPALEHVSSMVRGSHSSIAMRIPQHDFCLNLLHLFGHPIVSTSANRSGRKEHLSASTVRLDIGVECDYIVDLDVGGAKSASTIRDASTGITLR